MLPDKIIERYRVTDGDKFKLKDFDPGDTGDVDFDKQDGKEILEVGVKKLARLQERLYAEGKWAILMVLQGIDTAGKDGVIKHVWKFSPYDVEERKLWDQYQEVYEDTIRNTATKHAPWYVVPCDKKWFARLVVAGALIEQLEKLDLEFPKVSDEDMKAIEAAHAELLAEKKDR
jgi:polyphosphate kinase 2 (PPK2 family)